tara:strand:- start:653 stop:1315 length:663 start_codon:yes stop_codon:yes gene_type:complete
MENKLPKKRGRKPKTNIIVNDNPIFKNNNFNDIIVCINTKNIDINKYNQNIEEPNNFIQNKSESTTTCCNNCNIKLCKKFIELPIVYKNNIFYVSNKFCSFECANRYSFDNYHNYNEILSLLYLYKAKLTEDKNKSLINLPLPISTLKHNGGNITIDKYRKHFINTDITNIVCTLTHSIKILENNNINNHKINDLRLSRNKNKNKNKNNIFYKMNLDIAN